ncbi:hypothetical protein HWV62_39313 [Athelia sp. TMB]|nr:hypothetical protein HWV62_39313 [Athelia sp. TMB]
MGGHHNHGPPLTNSHASYPELNSGSGAKWIKHLTRDRLNTFNGGHFSDVNLSHVLYTHRLDGPEYIKLQVWSAPGLTKPTFDEAMKALKEKKFKPAKKGDSFGPSWTNHWWKVHVTIPGYWTQYERVQFEFDPGCEAMIFTTDGTPLQGITGGGGGDRRVEFILTPDIVKKGFGEFIIESSCNGMFGVPWNGDTIAPPDMNKYFSLASADLVVPNQEAWHLMWDFHTLQQLIDTLPGNTSLQNKALYIANEIMNTFQGGSPTDLQRCRSLVEEVFGKGWAAKGADIYKEGEQKVQIIGCGNCHIDTAWLWPYRVTQQKVARSWSTQVDLMERYPEHRFVASQAQQFKWLEQQYPKLFDKIKAKVKSGQFHPIGGSWVENDANMPSGEALARQMILGQRFFESRFGKRCDTAWLPDTFGLTGALPQLIRGAGMDYFFTQKLSWYVVLLCLARAIPDAFIIGTTYTYTAQATVGDVNKGVTNHKNLESSDVALLAFGNGDGGGGPLPSMLENLRRMRAVANNSREIPTVSMGQTVDEFFEDIARDTDQGARLPNWRGELYLEFHRGTYTSHGSIKKGNRKSEIMLRDVELVATLASLFALHKGSYLYPKTRIEDNWEKVLLNQFHDDSLMQVLPGSAIGMVYDDAEVLYAEVRKDVNTLLEEAFGALLSKSVPVSQEFPSKSLDSSGDLVAFNTTFFPRRDVVKIPLRGASSFLKHKVVQTSLDGSVGYALMDCSEGGNLAVPKGLFADSMPVSVQSNGLDDFVLRNSSVQLTISKGRITSLLDVQLERELIANGRTGGLIIFQDRPNYWDAWDVEIHHLETAKELKFSDVSITAQGPLRASVTAQVKYGNSTIKVTISLDAITASLKANSRSLFVFDAVVDWHQRHEFLKFELPLNIHSDNATYETQFGHVQRPTHKNTTWDMAKFEYADLSEFGYGVAFLSESKYGFACEGNVLRISLLRAATAPDAEQDQGKHEFSWAVMPHEGHFLESDVPIAAYIFNSPLHVIYQRNADPFSAVRYSSGVVAKSMVSTIKKPFTVEGARNVILETVKRGDGDGYKSKDSETSIVLRLYEAYGGHALAKLNIASHLAVKKAFVTNLLEDELEELNILRADDTEETDAVLKLDFRGFEVKTIKLVIGKHEKSRLSHQSGQMQSWVTIDKEQLF